MGRSSPREDGDRTGRAEHARMTPNDSADTTPQGGLGEPDAIRPIRDAAARGDAPGGGGMTEPHRRDAGPGRGRACRAGTAPGGSGPAPGGVGIRVAAGAPTGPVREPLGTHRGGRAAHPDRLPARAALRDLGLGAQPGDGHRPVRRDRRTPGPGPGDPGGHHHQPHEPRLPVRRRPGHHDPGDRRPAATERRAARPGDTAAGPGGAAGERHPVLHARSHSAGRPERRVRLGVGPGQPRRPPAARRGAHWSEQRGDASRTTRSRSTSGPSSPTSSRSWSTAASRSPPRSPR